MNPFRSLVDQTAMAGRFLTGLRRYLSVEVTETECHALLATRLGARAASFLELVRRGIYAQPESPYLWLLRHAGVEFGDVERLVGDLGVEGALGRLYDVGVHVTLDEFKAKRPLRRGSSTLATSARDFDNPLLTRHYETRTGGSRSAGTRLIVDLDAVGAEACYDQVFLQTFGLSDRPIALWRPVPPGSAGLKDVLRLARLGHTVDRWFSQVPVSFRTDLRHAAFVYAIAVTSRASGRSLAHPEHVPLGRADVIARWLATQTAGGRPAHLNTTASAAVRVAAAARDGGFDISGTFFRTGGEPLSPGKVRMIRAAGCAVASHYSMAEVGRIGVACGQPEADDDVHVTVDKVALLERDCRVSVGGHVPGLVLSTLQWGSPKIMLNVEVGDYGVLKKRTCGCPWDALGFTWHLHTIRSYEKLTSEGMHFVGADLITIVEDVLPAKFGGDATDYQFVEEEEEGLPRVSLIVSPRVGQADPAQLEATVLTALAAHGAANKMMAAVWADGRTIRVVRRQPYATVTGKIHSLHVPAAGATR